MSPRAVIEACRQGDRDAFRVLYEAYKDKVYSMALYFFHGDAAMAADVTQQVFLKLMGSIGQFRGESGFSTWLYRFVVNACVDTTRSRGARARMADPAVLDMLPAPGSQEEAFASAQVAGSVRAAVSSLAPKIRIAILLRYFEDLSYAEMADVLQVLDRHGGIATESRPRNARARAGAGSPFFREGTLMFQKHLSETLAAFVDGQLPPAKAADARAHIAECDRCRASARRVPVRRQA